MQALKSDIKEVWRQDEMPEICNYEGYQNTGVWISTVNE